MYRGRILAYVTPCRTIYAGARMAHQLTHCDKRYKYGSTEMAISLGFNW